MDHILDQAPISRPRTPSNFALPSPKFEQSPGGIGHQRRGSVVSDIINPLTGQPGARSKSRQNSFTTSSFGPLSTLNPSGDDSKNSSGDSANADQPMPSPIAGVPMPRPTPQVITTGASPEVATAGFPVKGVPFPVAASPGEISRKSSFEAGGKIKGPAPRQFQSADQLSSRLPPQLLALRNAGSGSGMNPSSPIGSSPASSPEHDPGHANSMANAQANPGVQTAARRMSMLAMTPTDTTGRERKGSNASEASGYASALPNAGPAILVNPKCSGYFVEPVSPPFSCFVVDMVLTGQLTWMEPILKNGDIGGKIVCPNEKCGAKIGNFDWAGVQCGCKEWVTPVRCPCSLKRNGGPMS
jgi:dual specificity phosphatase 12